MNTISIKPEMIRWALKRADLDVHDLQKPFPKLSNWEQGLSAPTLQQLEKLARRVWIPLGYFFLPAPPEEKLPIPDFRSVRDTPVRNPSPNLLETVYTMQRRQAWLRDFVIEDGAEPLPFVGSVTLHDNPIEVANRMRTTFDITPDWARSEPTWTQALLDLRLNIEKAGIVTVWNGVVGNHTRRKLDVEEFRGFVLPDSYVPLVFINSADAKAAQMFTLVHELAHIWLGKGGVLNLQELEPADNDVERFCNKVAAEFLVPKNELEIAWLAVKHEPEPFQALARRFKVSPLVAARRALDLGYINQAAFFEFYRAYMVDERRKMKAKPPGGNFYATCDLRLGRPFAEAIVRATKEGRLLYHEAYKLTGLQGTTFDKFAKKISREVG